MVLIVSLFDYSGTWSQPYRDAGYEVIQVDWQYGDRFDVMEPWLELLPNVHGVLAAPPCDDFARTGARWFAEKDEDGRTAESVAVVRRALDLIELWRPSWWALENPPGRLQRLVPDVGYPVFKFHPYHFGEPYCKTTWLWGDFDPPERGPIVEPRGNRKGQPPQWYSRVGGRSRATKNFRSMTCWPFARAFAEANP